MQTLLAPRQTLRTADKAAKAAELAVQVRQEHSAALASVRTSLEHARSAGQYLAEAKALVKHGDWRRWLQEETGIEERTAQLYILVAKSWTTIEPELAADSTLTDALRAIRAKKKSSRPASKPASKAASKSPATSHADAKPASMTVQVEGEVVTVEAVRPGIETALPIVLEWLWTYASDPASRTADARLRLDELTTAVVAATEAVE